MQPENHLESYEQPRFFCDEMLGHLARYLRAAGFDTRLACNGAPDSEILSEAIDEERWLLTRDRLIIDHKAARNHVILLPNGTLDNYAEALGSMFKMDWLRQSFTRCLVDNNVLEQASQMRCEQIPHFSRLAHENGFESVRVCPACSRAYWRGSHYRRMQDTLSRWQRLQRLGNE